MRTTMELSAQPCFSSPTPIYFTCSRGTMIIQDWDHRLSSMKMISCLNICWLWKTLDSEVHYALIVITTILIRKIYKRIKGKLLSELKWGDALAMCSQNLQNHNNLHSKLSTALKEMASNSSVGIMTVSASWSVWQKMILLKWPIKNLFSCINFDSSI